MPTPTVKAEEQTAATGAPWAEHWLELAGGRVRYLKAGSGPAIVLVHGLMGYSFSWRFTIPALAQHCTVYAYDSLGSGFSTSPAQMNCCMQAEAERLLGFVDAIGVESYDLLGTSHGGAVSMMAAAISRDRGDCRLKRLILVAPVNPWSPHGQRLAPFFGTAIGSLVFRNTILRWRGLDPLWLQRLFGDPAKIPADSLEGYRLPVLKNNSFEHGLKIVGSWTQDLHELKRALPKLAEYPTLLIWGSRDRAVSVDSAEPLRRNFRDCQLVVFPGIGHLPYEEAPQDFNETVLRWLCRK